MIDVHVLTLPGDNPAWLEQCTRSIRDAAATAPYSVHLRVLSGEQGHIGRARAAGYAHGEQPYVTFVDSDDYLVPDAFSLLTRALREGPEAVFTHELTLQGGVHRLRERKHHLAVYRRDITTAFPMADWCSQGDLALANSTRGVLVPAPAYVYRLRESPGRLLARLHPDELTKAWACEPSF
jgi:glycosyltransferase involved in cell wall biosynthesis